MTAAIFYHPEAYTTSGPRLMGRNAAGESFLRGFLKYSQAGAFWTHVRDAAHAAEFAATAVALGRTEPVTAVTRHNLRALADAGVLYNPGPGIGEQAWQRAFHGHGAWSLCGITHTTSSAAAMDAVSELVTAPVQPWDALICTSHAVKDNVSRVLQAQVDYLQERLGIQKVIFPQVPVIPLGIHTCDFSSTTAQRTAARQALQADEDTVVVLYMGRLSFHAKAHPLAMYRALEAAAKQAQKNVVLVECGWHANDFIARAYADAAKMACPSVRVVTLDGRESAQRQIAWASADLFCSLSDNIQETFGIAPIEAMAAGLPVVVSDWDGYKDTVRDGIDGFRIPTTMPEAGLGGDLAYRHALEIDTYDMYCGHACSMVAVDIEAAARAFSQLFSSPALRHQMGEAGRQRARTEYDWATIIPRYESLWSELNQLRREAGPSLRMPSNPWPARLDPFHGFASYPTQVLSGNTMLALVDADLESARTRAFASRQLTMVDFAKVVLPSDEEISSILAFLATGPASAADLVAGIAPQRKNFVLRALPWFIKMGVIKICP
jgi:alpha-maltose-1-phosphate synthase